MTLLRSDASCNVVLQTPEFVEVFKTKPVISRPVEAKNNSQEKLQLSYCIGYGMSQCILGRGGYGMVFKAEDLESGQVVALKKSRAPLRVKRPYLQYESRILQLLQGHPAIPKLYGYGHLKHFEYISLEVLGPSVADKADKEALTIVSVTRIVEQALSALKHVHQHGLVHRDIKPNNLLCSINDPSKIMLIDFNIAKRTNSGPPRTFDPIKDKKHIIGTVDWASLNSHRGIDLGPGDDLESLAYTALSLLRGNLPWRDGDPKESDLQGEIRVHRAKAAVSGSQLAMHFPADFAYFLDYSRGLDYHQMPDYDALEDRLYRLAESLGGYSKDDTLDWTSVPSVKIEPQHHDQDNLEGECDNVGYNENRGLKAHKNSYYGVDIDCWDDIHSSRGASVTLPTEVEELVDSQIPTIIEVHEALDRDPLKTNIRVTSVSRHLLFSGGISRDELSVDVNYTRYSISCP